MDLPAFLSAALVTLVLCLVSRMDYSRGFSFSFINFHFSLSPAQNLGGRDNRVKAQETTRRSMMPE
jgi:hypothetical protein